MFVTNVHGAEFYILRVPSMILNKLYTRKNKILIVTLNRRKINKINNQSYFFVFKLAKMLFDKCLISLDFI